VIVFLLIAAAIVLTGHGALTAIGRRLDPNELTDLLPLERATGAAVMGLVLWLAASWSLALTHTLTPASLWIVAAAFILAAVATLVVLRPKMPAGDLPPDLQRAIWWSMPVLLWTVFAFWRGAVLPPATHDALAYHLTRAILMVRTHGFAHFLVGDVRINNFPANYELLLADVLAMAGSDRLTEWIGTLTFLLFLLGGIALADRWWRSRGTIGVTLLAMAACPLLLLHSSAHKNDIMAGVFALTAIVFGARWCIHGGAQSLLLTTVSLAAGVGTKPHVGAVFLGLAPFLLWRAIRLIRARQVRFAPLALSVLAAAAAFCLAGVLPFLWAMTPDTAAVGVAGPGAADAAVLWGDYSNLWEVPLLLVMAPFSRADAIWIPWRGESWFWPRRELYFSNWGVLTTILIVLLPFCVLAFRRRGPGRDVRNVASLATLIAVAVILPGQIRPVGFFGAFGRYLIFVVPVIVAWTIPPLVDALRNSERARRAAVAVPIALVVLFGLSVLEYGADDAFTPLEFVLYAAEHPDTRRVFFMERAATVADRMAGPDDTMAIDGAYDSWSYPLYGAQLQRKVLFLPANAGAKDIPASVNWVVIDRSWSALWGDPRLTDMGKFWQYVGTGRLSDADLKLFRELRADPRFRLVYRYRRFNQAVFYRIGSTPGFRLPDVPRSMSGASADPKDAATRR